MCPSFFAWFKGINRLRFSYFQCFYLSSGSWAHFRLYWDLTKVILVIKSLIIAVLLCCIHGPWDLQDSPESVENCAVWVQANHSVLNGDAVHKRLLVIEEVGVWDPELVCYSVVQRQVERDPHIGQPLVSPILLEVHCQRVVLWGI